MKISKLTASLLTSTAVFAGVLVAQQGQTHTVSADSKLRVDYSSNLRQKAGTDANIIGGLKVGETYSYDKTATANGYTWYEIGANKWVASAGTKVTGGQVTVTDASNKRVGPSTSHKIAGGYYPGQKLTFTETVQAGGYTWYKVGKNAWVASAGVTETGVTRTTTQTNTPTSAATTTSTNTSAQTTTPATSTTANTTASTATSTAKAATPTTQTTTATTTTPTVTAASGKIQTTVASNVRSSADTSASVTGSLPAGTIRSYTATSVADGYTWYQIGTNQWVAGATPYTGTTATTSTPSTTSTQSTTSQTQSTASTSTVTQSSANTAASSTSSATTATSGTQTAKNSSGNTYAWGQCTWYVKSVASWAGNYWGNGAQWGASAAAEGFTVNHTPSVGSIVVVAGGQNFGGWTAAADYGHVAYVVGVSGNTITVHQGGMGFSNPAGPNTQTVSGASNFTYIHR